MKQSEAKAILLGAKAKLDTAIRQVKAGEYSDAHDKVNETIDMLTTLRDNI